MMKNKFWILLILFYNLFYTQNNAGDSLRKYTYEKLERKFYYYNNTNSTKEAKLFSKYYLHKAKQEKNKNQTIEGYVLMHFNETLPDALKYLDTIQSMTKDSKENYYPARVYLLRGNMYYKYDNLDKALENYLLTLKYAKQKMNKRQIAFAEINIAYLNNYIGKHKEAAKTLRYYLYNTDYLNEYELNDIHLNLASVYLDLEKKDSAKLLIDEGLQNYKSTNEDQYNKYLSLFGSYSLQIKKYRDAVSSLNSCKKYFLRKKNYISLGYTLLYLGQSYDNLNQKENSIKNFIQLDSLVQTSNKTFPELRIIYPYLIEFYKKNENRERQLYYIDRFLKVDSILDSQFRYISRELPEKYDTPQLVKEKERIISELKKRRTNLYISISFLFFVIGILSYLFYRSKKAEEHHRKIAQKLLDSVYETKEIKQQVLPDFQELTSPSFIQNTEIKDSGNKNVNENLVKIILKELEDFENSEGYLNKGITLGSLAKKTKTNTKYLSEIINSYKNKNFAAYLNDLRIEYAIKRLAKDKRFRSYKIPFIAEELGYNNEQAFTLAFKKRTGTTLSIYLKEIELVET